MVGRMAERAAGGRVMPAPLLTTGLASLMVDEAVGFYRGQLGAHIEALQAEHGPDGPAYFYAALITQLACAVQSREGTLFAQHVLQAARLQVDQRFGAFLADSAEGIPH